MSKDPLGLSSGLCFDRNEFTKVSKYQYYLPFKPNCNPFNFFQKSFSVDAFLHDHRHAGPLDQIRDDLGLHLKTLRLEMIELINEDYADFVNLSANLIGLDKSIEDIVRPIQSLRNELVTIKDDLQQSMSDIEKSLQDKVQLRKLKHSLECITNLKSTSESLQQLLTATDTTNPDSMHVERVILLLSHQNNYLKDCETYLKPDQLHSVKTLNTQAADLLKTFFLDAIRNCHRKNLECSLRLYSLLNATTTAESIYRADVLKPHLTKIISEQSLQNSPKGLMGIYNQLLQFVESDMKDLLQLGRQVDETNYDFLLHSLWPEVEHRLEVHMSSIFAPGNPNFFYHKYQCTVDFLTQFEGHTSRPEEFRRHKQYQSFLKRWNLPVYFQIRFQEIGGAVETELAKSLTTSHIRSGQGIRLVAVAKALECVNTCWSEGVYLEPLLARFLKLTLQIYGRVNNWLRSLIQDEKLSPDNIPRTEFLMIIYGDVQQLKQSVPPLIVQVKNLLKCAANVSIDRCFTDALDLLKANENLALSQVAKLLFEQSEVGIRQVTDIPRLYRKTNRELPTKPCPYVEEIIGPVMGYKKVHGEHMEAQHLQDTLTLVLSQINAQYFCAVDEVLTSVQKTEESLRRLKTLREKSTAQTQMGSDKTPSITDDDKIRAQFYVDVGHWSKRIEEMGVPKNTVDRLPELLSLVNQFSR